MIEMELYENSLRENKKHLLVLKIKQYSCRDFQVKGEVSREIRKYLN